MDTTTPLSIAPGQALTLPPGPAGRRLRVLQGRLWLTASGCPDDEVVDAGADHALPAAGRGTLVVEALDGPVRAELAPAVSTGSVAVPGPGWSRLPVVRPPERGARAERRPGPVPLSPAARTPDAAPGSRRPPPAPAR